MTDNPLIKIENGKVVYMIAGSGQYYNTEVVIEDQTTDGNEMIVTYRVTLKYVDEYGEDSTVYHRQATIESTDDGYRIKNVTELSDDSSGGNPAGFDINDKGEEFWHSFITYAPSFSESEPITDDSIFFFVFNVMLDKSASIGNLLSDSDVISESDNSITVKASAFDEYLDMLGFQGELNQQFFDSADVADAYKVITVNDGELTMDTTLQKPYSFGAYTIDDVVEEGDKVLIHFTFTFKDGYAQTMEEDEASTAYTMVLEPSEEGYVVISCK